MTDVNTLPNGNIKLPMACACGDERKLQMDEMRNRAREILGLPDESRLLSSILYTLNFYFKGRSFSLDHVSVDQWMAITVSEFVYGESKYDGGGLKKIMVHCDRFEDGLARLFLYIYDNYEHDEDS